MPTSLCKVCDYMVQSCRLWYTKSATSHIKVGNFKCQSGQLWIIKSPTLHNTFSTFDTMLSIYLILYIHHVGNHHFRTLWKPYSNTAKTYQGFCQTCSTWLAEADAQPFCRTIAGNVVSHNGFFPHIGKWNVKSKNYIVLKISTI